MKALKSLLFLLIAFQLFSCKTTSTLTTSSDDGIIDLIILQINDVYEIAPLEGGKVGGMARFATLRKQLLAENPNTLTVHAGDFLNPSLIGVMKHDGEKIKGKQMVEVMNLCGIDLVTPGNHEFDLKEAELQKRINESEFEWLGTNIQQRVCDQLYPFYKEKNGKKHFFPETYTWEAKDADGTQIQVGFFGATINSNPKDYVLYKDHKAEAIRTYNELLIQTDLVIGLTHLEIDQDLELAKHVPQTPLIMGGHDHDNMKHQVGNTTITKADANVKSAYVHRIQYNKNTKTQTVKSNLVKITDAIADDKEVLPAVERWTKILNENLKQIVENPDEVIYQANPPLDGRESTLRNKQSNLGEVMTKAIAQAAKNEVDCSIMNSGSVRIDDQISGNITAVDIFRALPYGGPVLEVDMKGNLLAKVLDEGVKSRGKGAYLQRNKIEFNEEKQSWWINGMPLDVEKTYHVGLNDYLMLGLDIKSLKEGDPDIVAIDRPDPEDQSDIRNDVRVVVIEYLKGLNK